MTPVTSACANHAASDPVAIDSLGVVMRSTCGPNALARSIRVFFGVVALLSATAAVNSASAQSNYTPPSSGVNGALEVWGQALPQVRRPNYNPWQVGFWYGSGGGFLGRYDSFDNSVYEQPEPDNNAEFEKDICAGNPILIGSGTKVQLDTDVSAEGEMALGLTRRYSSSGSSGVFGDRWSSNLDHSISRDGCYASIAQGANNCPPSPLVVEVITNLGERHAYQRGGDGIYRKPADTFSSLEKVSGGYYVLRRADDSVMRFRPDGRVESIVNTHGLSWTYSYLQFPDGTQRIGITRSGGRSLELNLSAGPYPVATTVTDAAGKLYTYGYGDFGRLATVTYPGGASDARSYSTEFGQLKEIGIGGVNYASFRYHDNGRGKETFHAGGVEKVSLAYSTELDSVLGEFAVTDVTNALGATTRYKFQNNKLRFVDRNATPDCPAAATERQYDSNGHLSRSVDWNGVATRFSYSSNGQLLERVDGIHPTTAPQGLRYTEHSWDTKNRIIETREGEVDIAANHLRRPTRTTSIVFNPATAAARNRVASITRTSHIGRSVSETTTFAYTVHSGNLIRTLIADGPRTDVVDSTTTTLNVHGDTESVANALGHTTRYQTNAWGRPTRITDANNAVVDVEYDDRGRVASQTAYHDGVARQTVFSYDRFGNVASIVAPGQPIKQFAYDTAGRLASSRSIRSISAGDTLTDSTEREYNLLSRPIKIKAYVYHHQQGPCTPTTCVSPNTFTFLRTAELRNYDSLGRLKSISEAEFAPTPSSSYYEPPLQAGRTTTFHYDNNGNVVRIEAPEQRVTKFEYDPLERLTKSTDALNRATVTTYRFGGSPLALEEVIAPPSGGSTTTAFDGFGNTLSQQSPDTGLTTYTYAAEDSRLASLKRADDSTVTYTHDAIGRVIQASAPQVVRRTASLDNRMARLNPTPALRASAQAIDNNKDIYTYDTCGNGIGRLCNAVHGASYWTTDYSYTPHGAIASQTETRDGVAMTVSYTHDSFGRPTGMTYGDETQITYEYTDGQPSAVRAIVGGQSHTVINGVEYWFGNQASGYTYGNGALRSLSRNLQGRTTAIGTGTAQALTYAYDNVGRLQQIVNDYDSAATQTYGYESTDRLTSSTRTGASENWTLNPIGHRNQHVRAAATFALSYAGNSNRLTGISNALTRSYGSDALGSRKTQTDNGLSTDYHYDQAQQQKYLARWQDVGTVCEPTGDCTFRAAGVWEYGYNHRGQRMYKTDNGVVNGNVTGRNWITRYLHAPSGELLAETGQDVNDSAAPKSIYVWFGGEPVGVIRDGQVHYIANDHLGRPEVIADAAQTPVWRARNLAFHREVIHQDASFGAFNLGFPGQYFDAESGLYYNWHRYYDPSTGRYTQSDPIGLVGGTNSYAYVGGNPVSFVDPLGLESVGPWNNGSMNNIADGEKLTPCQTEATLDLAINMIPITAVAAAIGDTLGLEINLVHNPGVQLGDYGIDTPYAATGHLADAVGYQYEQRAVRQASRAQQRNIHYSVANGRANRANASARRGGVARGVAGKLGIVGAMIEFADDMKKCECEL